MTKEELIANFDPNGPAENDNIFGLPFAEEHAQIVILPVPWEVSVSYSAGTAHAPLAIKQASAQVDLFDPAVEEAWKIGVWMAPIDEDLLNKSNLNRTLAEKYLESFDESLLPSLNAACAEMVNWVETQTTNYLDQNKFVALLGGDHSTPMGYLKALAKRHDSFGILQIDAHADLRDAYEGFEYSHASIMYNALKIPQISKLVQVGIRDYCEEEKELIENGRGLITTFFDRDLKHQQYKGKTWAEQVSEIVSHLPELVYLSFDIDGLDPKLCPNTGTPVAGGFEAEEILFLIEKVIAAGKRIIGFDLNEVSPGEDEWDANVGARLLWRLCNLAGNSNQLQ